MKYFTSKFLKIEEKSRNYFEKWPFFHAFFAGIGVVLFWRGTWEVADRLGLNPYLSILLGSLILLILGLFLQTFVGNTIIIKKVENEKKLDLKTKNDLEKVEKEVDMEEVTLEILAKKLEAIESKLEDLNNKKV
jgi:hypothetical protein